MQQAWRWYGLNDSVSLNDIRQAGADYIVSALYDVPIGDVWQHDDIMSLKNHIEQYNGHKTSLFWSVVESIPVHDDIKRGAMGWQKYADSFIQSCHNLSLCGITKIAYNFMPLLDWTRTDLHHQLANGATCLRFDYLTYIAFDCFILNRDQASKDYAPDLIKKAQELYHAMDIDQQNQLTLVILAGLPGGMGGSFNLEEFKQRIALYSKITSEILRQNLINFLHYVTPKCEEFGVTLALHPDDPPFSLFGLPRVVSSHDDLRAILESVPSKANQLTFCTGSLGVRADNDLVKMAQEFKQRVAFAHFRGTRRDQQQPFSFQEADHLDSDVDMVGVIKVFLEHEAETGAIIPFRPDHGHQMLDDLGKSVNPGYSAIGRLKGLAELRGVICALSR